MRPLLLLVVLAGCGGSSALESARSTLAITQRVVTDVDSRVAHHQLSAGGDAVEGDAVRHALSDVRARLDEGEHSVDSWAAEDSGDLAWRTIAPCLATALGRLAGALRAVHAPEDRDLEEAITKSRAEAVDECHEAEPDQ